MTLFNKITIFCFLFITSAVSQDDYHCINGIFDFELGVQQSDAQRDLEAYFDESAGYFITGPLETRLAPVGNMLPTYSSLRIICPDIMTYNDAVKTLDDSVYFGRIGQPIDRKAIHGSAPRHYYRREVGHRGEFAGIGWKGIRLDVQVNTINQTRFMIWLRDFLIRYNYREGLSDEKNNYSMAVSDYLAQIDSGHYDAKPPEAIDYGLPEKYDFYAEPPDYVIEGYQNYKNFLYGHDEIITEFAHGITAFIPTDSTLQWLKENAPREAFPNKEAAKLQEEYRKFFERGGDVRIMQTLTAEGFDTLKTGEYFFAVGTNGKIRFAREMPREEVRQIEEETGRKVPRANHAFLFPGEVVLTAGAFFIDERVANKLVKVNAQSGHYFYSNITPSIREDIADLSNYYLLTLGHLFKALDRVGIPYDNILISKL